MAKLDELFRFMKKQGASDLHLTSESPPFFRINGEMVSMNYRSLNANECKALLFEILSEKQKQELIENLELDCSYAVEGVGRFRCNVFFQRKGIGAVFRIIPEKVISLDQLGMPPILKTLCHEHKGLIVVTGPTGSGKSTTLAAMIDYINEIDACHIITVEDPIEFVYENKKSLINQREVSSSTKSFGNALRASLREDPDIILVGEMRDLETISLAMTAAETGHLVFGTLHTNSAAKTVDRIIDVFPEAQQAQIRVMLSESLKAVVAQTLLPSANGKGRMAANEILINTKAISNLIREGKTYQIPSTMQTSRSSGMQTFEHNIELLIGEGRVSKKAAYEFLGKTKLAAQVRQKTQTDINLNAKSEVSQIKTPPPMNTNTNLSSIPVPPNLKKNA